MSLVKSIVTFPSHTWETFTSSLEPVRTKTWFCREQGLFPDQDEFSVKNPEPELLFAPGPFEDLLIHTMRYPDEDPHRLTCAACRFARIFYVEREGGGADKYLELTNPDGAAWIWKLVEYLEHDHAFRMMWPD